MVKAAAVGVTSHKPTATPPEYRISAVPMLNEDFPLICVESLVNRLHETSNAFVALKCLFWLHNIIPQDGSLPRDHKRSPHGIFGGRNELNVHKFNDLFYTESAEYSFWLRWYGEVLEVNVVALRSLSHQLFYRRTMKEEERSIHGSFNKDLLRELGTLASLIKRVANAPRSLHLQRNNLVYEIVALVCQDYWLIRREKTLRVEELSRRMDRMKVRELARLLAEMERITGCKGRLFGLFVNKANSDGLWELWREPKVRVVMLINERTHWLPRLDNVNYT